jgi:molybdopterin-guanine dinucleotide biosynthesis protein A
MIARTQLTGLVLAGGRGSRMGGVDKGLQPHRGMPLAQHALQRLRPQVGALMVNANRNHDAYAAFGAPVWPDARTDYPGPLAGMLAGLAHCTTPYLVTVPCDTPDFPPDLVARLAAALTAEGAEIAVAATREGGMLRTQPVFCLLSPGLAPSLAAFLDAGERKIERWTGRHRVATAVFDDPAAFFNANTAAELQQLQAGG